MQPAVFVSHGAPTLPLDSIPARNFLAGLGARLGRPEAVLVVSAHWDTAAPAVGGALRNTTIHDFSGFPKALYDLRYDAPGAPALASRIAGLLAGGGMDCRIETARGLDHGAWVPLMLMYPSADVPVVQVSVQSRAGAAHHLELGRALKPLRDEGVLILASGGLVHNLGMLDWTGRAEPGWSRAFADWVHAMLLAGDEEALADYRTRAPMARQAHPTEEHFLPLLVAMGAGGPAIERLHQSAVLGSLRMDAYGFF